MANLSTSRPSTPQAMAVVCGVTSDTGIPPSMTITIAGGGSGAHVSAAYLGSKQNLCVNVLTRQPDRWSKDKKLVLKTAGTSWEAKGTIVGNLNCVTSDPSKVIPQSDIVIVAAPGHAQPDILRAVAPHVKCGVVLGSIFGQGGFDWASHSAFHGDWSKIDILFCLQNIPWLCRTQIYGHEVQLIGPKKNLWTAAWPPKRAVDIARVLSLLYDIPCATVPNFLTVTLTPSNQIIHPARYYGIFHKWDGKTPFAKEDVQWGLYTETDDLSAQWMEKLDAELQALRHGLETRFPELNLSALMPLGPRIVKQYGEDVGDTTSLKTIFRTNKGYAGCKTPAVEVSDGKFFPAVESRLFVEDIPFGLCILKSVSQMLGLATPSIDFQIEWHQKWMGKEYLKDGKLNPKLIGETAAPEAYGITSLEKLVAASLPSSSDLSMPL